MSECSHIHYANAEGPVVIKPWVTKILLNIFHFSYCIHRLRTSACIYSVSWSHCSVSSVSPTFSYLSPKYSWKRCCCWRSISEDASISVSACGPFSSILSPVLRKWHVSKTVTIQFVPAGGGASALLLPLFLTSSSFGGTIGSALGSSSLTGLSIAWIFLGSLVLGTSASTRTKRQLNGRTTWLLFAHY